MSDEIYLEPCPFCGGPAHLRDDSCHSKAFYIGCSKLGCFGSDQWEETQAEAIAAWNTRADIAAAQVAAAYERAADLCVDQFQAHLDLVITGNPDNARNRESAANMAEKLSHEIRALATDTQTDALEQVRKEAERAGYERMRAKAEKLVQYLDRIDSASNHYAMTPTYSEGTLRYAHQSTRNLAREALKEWYEGDPDEQTDAAQELAFRKAVSS